MESFSASQELTTRFWEEDDNTRDNLIKRSPSMFMDGRGERAPRTEGLMMVIEATQWAGMAKEAHKMLTTLVLHSSKDVFRRRCLESRWLWWNHCG